METLGIGHPITTPQSRDAIHIAVIPAVAATNLKPGAHVGVRDWTRSAGQTEPVVGKCDKPLGIVDPYLKSPLKRGERFWLHLYPYTIQSLRHHWIHKDLPEELSMPDKPPPEAPITPPTPEWAAAAGLLQGYASFRKEAYDKLVRDMADAAKRGNGLAKYPPEAWKAYETAVGAELPAGLKSSLDAEYASSITDEDHFDEDSEDE